MAVFITEHRNIESWAVITISLLIGGMEF